MTVRERIEEYSMKGAKASSLRENLADGSRLAVLCEHRPVQPIETVKVKVGERWIEL